MIERKKKVFFLGIKGVAMSNLAIILKKMGKEVLGSDTDETFITDEILHKNNIEIITDFSPEALPNDIDLALYSAAHGGTNHPQILKAKKRGVDVISQAELLGELMTQFKTPIAVAGCHGKTTTSGLLAYALLKLNAKPSYMVGVSGFNEFSGGDFHGNDYFVVEADEYGVNPPSNKNPKFHFLKPKYCITTNIDFDHPDVYKDLDDTKNAFLTFFQNIVADSSHKLFVCSDNEALMDVVQNISNDSYVTFGFNSNADIRIYNQQYSETSTKFDLDYKKQNLGTFTISLFGEQNISNAVGVIGLLLYLGFSPDKIKDAIHGYTGAKRRFEMVAKVKDSYIFDDYAHHPKEIDVTISAAKKRFPNKRIVVIFQPHTYSRTEQLKNEFVESLSSADFVIIAPIFGSAREGKEHETIMSKDLELIAKSKNNQNIISVEEKKEIIPQLEKIIKPGDVVFTMGAGDIYKIKNDIIRLLEKVE